MHKLRNAGASIVLFMTLGLLIACSRHPSDETIAKEIQNKAAADPETHDSQINVSAKDGKVALSGTVMSPAAQQKLEQIAHQEPGVTGVDDQTVVEGGAAAAEQATQAMAPPPPPPVEKPKPIVVPAGTVLTVRTEQALSSKTSQTGQTFMATLAQPVSVAGRAALPAGSTVSGTVVTAKASLTWH